MLQMNAVVAVVVLLLVDVVAHLVRGFVRVVPFLLLLFRVTVSFLVLIYDAVLARGGRSRVAWPRWATKLECNNHLSKYFLFMKT